MNSPLRDHERIILRFPLSLSTMSGEPRFIEAHKALNGLRVASLTWSVFLKDIVSKVNLSCSITEPCLYGGVIDGSPTLLLCYIDDLLIASSSDKAFHCVFKELSKHVKVRDRKDCIIQRWRWIAEVFGSDDFSTIWFSDIGDAS